MLRLPQGPLIIVLSQSCSVDYCQYYYILVRLLLPQPLPLPLPLLLLRLQEVVALKFSSHSKMPAYGLLLGASSHNGGDYFDVLATGAEHRSSRTSAHAIRRHGVATGWLFFALPSHPSLAHTQAIVQGSMAGHRCFLEPCAPPALRLYHTQPSMLDLRLEHRTRCRCRST